MPKARKRTGKYQSNNRPGKATTVQSRLDVATRAATAPTSGRAQASQANRAFLSPTVRGPQSLIMPGMVAAGCWLMAFTLFFLSTDPNRNLFGGMAVLMGALWTFSFGTRMRKLLLLRQRV